jgi:hypothetical protein
MVNGGDEGIRNYSFMRRMPNEAIGIHTGRDIPNLMII